MTETLAQEFTRMRNRVLVEDAPDDLLAEQVEQMKQYGQEPASDSDGIDRLIWDEHHRRERVRSMRAVGPLVEKPLILIESDFDDYFGDLVSRWIRTKLERGERFYHATIIVKAGAYRSSAVSCKSDGKNTLSLDFYSAIRNGFGGLSRADEQTIMDRWL